MIAVDANVLMELIESRRQKALVRSALAHYRLQEEKAAFSTLTLSHVFYLAEAHKVPLKRVEKLTAVYSIYDVTRADVDWALGHYNGKDFEDALQVAAAIREKCTVFLTLDAPLAKKYGKFLKIELVGP